MVWQKDGSWFGDIGEEDRRVTHETILVTQSLNNH